MNENEESVQTRINESEAVVIFTKGEDWGSMLATFVKSPLGMTFKAVVPKEKVFDTKYPWIESTLAEIYQTQFGSRIKRSDITTIIALEESITMGITLGNKLKTLAVESADYIEVPAGSLIN